jgi:hypothetical protein
VLPRKLRAFSGVVARLPGPLFLDLSSLCTDVSKSSSFASRSCVLMPKSRQSGLGRACADAAAAVSGIMLLIGLVLLICVCVAIGSTFCMGVRRLLCAVEPNSVSSAAERHSVAREE